MYKSNCAECVRDAKASGATFTFTSCLGKPPLAPLPPLPLQPCWWKHIKGEWLQVNLVQPGHQPRDDTTHRWSHPPFYIIVSALSEQWIVKRLVVATYPAYFQNNCHSLIVIPSGLASKKRMLNIFFYLNHMSLNILPYLLPIPSFLCGRTSLSVINRIISFYHNRVAKLRLPS